MLNSLLYKTRFPLGQIALFTAALVITAVVIAKAQLLGVASLVAIPVALAFAVLLFRNPRYGIIATLIAGFLAIGLTRYVAAPLGLSLDFILVLTVVATLFTNPRKWVFASNILTWMTVIWFGYTLLELLNPLSVSRTAWFYAVRGVSLYNFMLIPLTFILFVSRKDLSRFFKIWLVFSVAAALWGIKQIYIGLDHAEESWLHAGGAITHVINGRLRAFSFYSDAGQFGAAMAHVALVSTILGLTPDSGRVRWWYFSLAALFLFAMVISGTRGAYYVPAVGFMAFLLLVKNFRVFAVGILGIAFVFSFLKFTSLGHNNYHVRRLRSALNPDDPSLVVRRENQKKIATYLHNKPFGAGIGSGGSWALRFAPESFLATTPLDSWYVRIWAETGIVGLSLHLIFIALVLLLTIRPILHCRDVWLKYRLIALYCGFLGMAFASYGNQIFGQSPSGVILALSMVFMFSVKRLLPDAGQN